MRKRCFSALLTGLLCLSASAAKYDATWETTPSPVVKTKGFEVTITTTDMGEDVYCYTWTEGGSQPTVDWGSAIAPKYKMTRKSSGVYSIAVDDIKTFYSLSDAQMESLTTIGFIARTTSGQTEDCMVPVSEMRQAYSGGEGTVESPFVLSNAADMAELAATPSDWAANVCFILSQDIILGDFPGIGSMEKPFHGIFNGNDHVISDVRIAGTSAIGSATGLFCAIEGATITNLGVADATVSGATYCGVLVGYAFSGTVSRCFTSGSVTATSICSGGLAGENKGADISDSYSTASVSSPDGYACGGLVGKNLGSISRCYSSGRVSAANYAGGMVGANYGTITNSVAMNSGIEAPEGANYVARFGGNDNSQNTQHTNFSWPAMATSQSAWSTYGHHAIEQTPDLLSKSTFSETLGWDFDDVWQWERGVAPREYPVLARIGGQVDPSPGLTALEIAGGTLCGRIEVFPTVVDDFVTVESADGVVGVYIASVSGTAVAKASYAGSSTAMVDCSGLPCGMYLLSVVGADGSIQIVKIVKR